jgi:NAD dependent epimerase/dehydratase family enzyme
MRVAVTGASGLIGTSLLKALRADGHQVQRLVRRPTAGLDEVTWDPDTRTVDLEPLSGVDAVVHLAGSGVGDKRWTATSFCEAGSMARRQSLVR